MSFQNHIGAIFEYQALLTQRARIKGLNMKSLKKLFAIATMMSMLMAPAAYSQDACCEKTCDAYCDSCDSTYMSALIPIGALVIAGVLIATTNRHHHHSSGTTTGNSHGHFVPSSGSSSGSFSSSGS